jgi:hypothetical protein
MNIILPKAGLAAGERSDNLNFSESPALKTFGNWYYPVYEIYEGASKWITKTQHCNKR